MRKNVLDAAEGVGEGYADHTVEVITPDGARISARTCVGTTLGPGLKPYGWYKAFALGGARVWSPRRIH